MGRITRLVFWLEGVVISPDSAQLLRPGMVDVLDAVHHRFELLLISKYPASLREVLIAKSSLSSWFADEDVYPLPEQLADHQAINDLLIQADVIIPGKTLWIDPDPVRTMLALRQGIDVSIFVDARRLYRDLGLWGMVPLE